MVSLNETFVKMMLRNARSIRNLKYSSKYCPNLPNGIRVNHSAFMDSHQRSGGTTLDSSEKRSFTTLHSYMRKLGGKGNHGPKSLQNSFRCLSSNENKPIGEKQDDNNAEPEKPEKKSRRGVLLSMGLGASFLFGKMKFVLVALKISKAAPLISMVVTSATYSLFFGWPYAIGMVGLIFVHECGHAIVMKYYNVPFSPMVFIPFVGAVISMKEMPRNAYEEAIIAFGGPVLGSAAALSLAAAGAATDNQLLYALADWGLMINLFNLLPLGTLDGGRIGSAINPYFGVLGVAGSGALIFYGGVTNPLFYLITMAGTYQTTSRIFGWEEVKEDYYNQSRTTQFSLFAGYVGLIAGLLVAMRQNNAHRKTPNQLKYERETGETTAPWENNPDGVYDDIFPVTQDNFNFGEGFTVGK